MSVHRPPQADRVLDGRPGAPAAWSTEPVMGVTGDRHGVARFVESCHSTAGNLTVAADVEGSGERLDTCDIVVDIRIGETYRPTSEAVSRLRPDRPVLPIWTTVDSVQVGPWLGSALEQNCLRCVVGRRWSQRAVLADGNRSGESTGRYRVDGGAAPPGWIWPTVRVIVLDEIANYRRRSPRLVAATMEIDVATAVTVIRPTFRDADCPRCAPVAFTDRTTALASTRRRMAGRRQRMDASIEVGSTSIALDSVVDPRTGLVDAVGPVEGSTVPAVAATLYTASGDNGREVIVTAGRAESSRCAREKALFEALERYSALWPPGRSVFRATVEELADSAVDPAALVLHSPLQYRRPGFRYRPPHRRSELSWVWAHDVVNDRWRALPLQSVHYGMREFRGPETFAYETSNGAALGADLPDATRRGLLEVIERHAFLMAWYRREVNGRVPMDRAADPRAEWIRERLSARGYDLRLFDITPRCGVPVVWAIALGRAAGSTVSAVTGLAADLRPGEAQWRASLEAACGVADAERRAVWAPARVSELADDYRLVSDMADHVLMYTDFSTRGHLDFVLEAGWSAVWPTGRDPVGDSGYLLGAPRREGIESDASVLVTDMTGPEIEARGLRAVRVTVPGMLPMTFGFGNERVEGATVLTRALGEDRSSGRYNRIPHPFC